MPTSTPDTWPPFYSVQATVSRESPDGWGRTQTTLPTFYLNTRVQGIVDVAHAERIVTAMIHQLIDTDRLGNDPACREVTIALHVEPWHPTD